MRDQQRSDPLSRLVGTSTPPRPASIIAPVTGTPVDDDTDDRASNLAPDTQVARVAQSSAQGAERDSGPSGDLLSLMRDEAPDSPAVASDALPSTGRGRRAGGAANTDATTAGVSATCTTSASASADTSSGGTSTGAATNALEALAPAIDQARTFAERWEAPYRAEVFRVALGQLLGTVERSLIPGGATGIGSPSRTAAAAVTGAPPRLSANLGPAEKLARQLSVDVDAVDRTLQFEDGRVIILARIDGNSRRELQIKYGLVLLYVKEIALATRLVDIDELRAVCVEHGCYDQGNFVGNFKKAQQDGFMREQPAEKGARVRRYMLTQKGMNEAAALLRELVLQ